MKIISFIQPSQRDVIEKILRHCGLWEAFSRAPPPDDRRRGPRQDLRQRRYVSDLDFADAAPPEPVWTAD